MNAITLNQQLESGARLVDDLMVQQDVVLEQLAQLNQRVESMIKELSAQRAEAAQLDEDAERSEATTESVSLP